MNTYDIGDAVLLQSSFTADGVPTDPTSVTLRITDPTGAETDYAAIDCSNPSTGVYTYQVTANIAGSWHYRFEATGNIVAAQDGSFVVTSAAPTWTYSVDQLATVPLYQVRFLIGDTVDTEPQLQDAEVNFALGLRSTIYGAAAECCRSLQAKFSRSVDQQAGGVKVSYSQLARAYGLKAIEFETKAAMTGAGLPYAGGMSSSDMLVAMLDQDRLQPQFRIGMSDATLPVPPIGPESQASNQSDVGLR